MDVHGARYQEMSSVRNAGNPTGISETVFPALDSSLGDSTERQQAPIEALTMESWGPTRRLCWALDQEPASRSPVRLLQTRLTLAWIPDRSLHVFVPLFLCLVPIVIALTAWRIGRVQTSDSIIQ